MWAPNLSRCISSHPFDVFRQGHVRKASAQDSKPGYTLAEHPPCAKAAPSPCLTAEQEQLSAWGDFQNREYVHPTSLLAWTNSYRGPWKALLLTCNSKETTGVSFGHLCNTCHVHFSPIQIGSGHTSQLGLSLVKCFWSWSQANPCWGIYSQEYHKYDSLLALQWILFLNDDFHHSSKNRGWLWNITSAPAFSKGYAFLILRLQFPRWCLARPGLLCRGVILWKTPRRRCLWAAPCAAEGDVQVTPGTQKWQRNRATLPPGACRTGLPPDSQG